MTGQSLRRAFGNETELVAGAVDVARAWADFAAQSLLIGLQGQLGSGKTTWARGLLGGLGYTGRVPSPTYTLVELYPLHGLTLVHADLYRLEGDADRELDALGIREWLAREATWVLVEWPERSPLLVAQTDLAIRFEPLAGEGRELIFTPQTAIGISAVEQLVSGA